MQFECVADKYDVILSFLSIFSISVSTRWMLLFIYSEIPLMWAINIIFFIFITCISLMCIHTPNQSFRATEMTVIRNIKQVTLKLILE